MKLTRLCSWLLMAIIMAGCASITSNAPANKPSVEVKNSPIVETVAAKKAKRSNEWRPETYVVQKGDTLYSIAFNYGFGYRELAELNGIQNPSAISIGQTIRLFPNKATPSATGVGVEKKPTEPPIKEQPKLVKYPYSTAAMALIDKIQQAPHPESIAQPSPAPIGIVQDNNTSAMVAKEVEKAKPDDNADDEKEEPALDWSMPTQGKLIAHFSESANRKGIDIAGKLGQPVLASAAGKVVYSGSGLRGYGKLIIIKHNATYLSAYAHNDKILVKEGQSVTRGQKIAAMGSTDADQVKLHFEVRRLGKPVDPAKFLSLTK
ncbi:MAG: peptidoglycan DD-metalloendopeptidase family protein [Gallionella sp.]|nr:peptidoglycan DD-metalloendopeptidase family protein [Gallionella sp.]